MKNLLRKKAHHEEASKVSAEPVETQLTSSSELSGFKKIEIKPDMKTKKKPWLKILLITIVVLLVIVGAVGVTTVMPLLSVKTEAEKLMVSGRALADSLKTQNLAETKNKLPEVKQGLENVAKEWDKAVLLKYIPFLNNYHKDVVHALNAGRFGLEAMEIAVVTVEPYSDLLGFTGGASFVSGSADERIQLAVATLDKVTPKIGEIAQKIDLLKKEADAIDPERYPESVRGTIVRGRLVEGKKLLEETAGLFLNAQPLLEVLPQLLGQPDAKRYLVLFQNDAELRPTGGFLTAYAIFKIEKGKFIVEKSDDIYELDDQIINKKPAPEEILTYHKGVYYANIRDSNLSPDFTVSMERFKELYPGKFDFDGIISVDTHVLVEAIKILGEFQVKGRTFNSEIDPRCDCPKVIYELEDYSTRPVNYVREERKDVLGDLLLQIMKKALGVSPSQYWGQLFQMGLSEINQKHIIAYMTDEKAQKGIESLNMGGRIADGVVIMGYKDGQSWDYLHINDANMAGGKSNLFIEHEIAQNYETDNNGNIIKTVTITYKNPAKASDCNLETGGLCLNAHVYRNWIRIYVPKGSELIESNGSVSPKDDKTQADMMSKEDLGKTVFEGFLTLRPLGSAQLTVKYRLPFKAENKALTAFIQKQPGTDGHEFTTSVNGKAKEQFTLVSDKVSLIKL